MKLLTPVLLALALSFVAPTARAQTSLQVISQVQPKVVKIFGAGGLRGLEAYQSGFLISPDGKILTAWSYVLDTEDLFVSLHDGRRLRAKLLGADAQRELAVLQVEATDLPYFDLNEAVQAVPGTRVLAFSNLFGVAVGDEPVSVQHGVVAIIADLNARRGTFETPYRGPAYILDAMTNNPGAAGGALTDSRGQLLGILGKELRNAATNTWLNYALPANELAPIAERLGSGEYLSEQAGTKDEKPAKPLRLADLGLIMVPNVIERTPPFLDGIHPDSAAARAGLRIDDLVVLLDGRLVQSRDILEQELARIDRGDPVVLSVMRGTELIEVTLRAD